MLQVAKYDIGGKDMCAGADSIRWLQTLATEMAKAYQPETTKTVALETPAKPSEGFTVKSYNPGKVGKK